MSTPFLPLTDAEATSENQKFWVGLRDGRIDLPYCSTCDRFVWYPRAICPTCHKGDGVAWRTLPGTGCVYSYSIVAKGSGRWKDSGPYVVAYVQLDSGIAGIEGPRVLTNVVGDAAHKRISIDSPVTMIVDRDAERILLRFVLA